MPRKERPLLRLRRRLDEKKKARAKEQERRENPRHCPTCSCEPCVRARLSLSAARGGSQARADALLLEQVLVKVDAVMETNAAAVKAYKELTPAELRRLRWRADYRCPRPTPARATVWSAVWKWEQSSHSTGAKHSELRGVCVPNWVTGSTGPPTLWR
ncbi:MAG: hypothetical protein CMA58_01550 [Euryarchaeota archaeon]|nr:hypothetical protein [Euryarchaeota archaeon]